MLVPPRVTPPDQPLGRLAGIARFVRNPLAVIPRAVYERDYFPAAGGVRTPVAWVTGPELLRGILLEQRDKFRKLAQIRLLSPLLGKGILTSEGADWKWQRQAASPVFRHQDALSFVPAFVRASEALLARWRAAPAGSVQAIDRDMTQVTFDVISATLLPSADATVAPAVEAATARFQRAGAWGQLYAIANVPRWLPQPGRSSMAIAVQVLRSSVHAMLKERREGGSKDDLMHRLMQARDPETGQAMNDSQLVDNLLTFYLAGHETTAKALTWTLFLLSRSPEWRERLEEEIARVTGGAPLEARHLEALVLTQQVLKESMRLYPPVPLMTRQAVADAELAGHAIRKGTSLVMPIYAMHRHRLRWSDPDAFDPERFAPAAEAQIPRYQYMPFGAGPRICIGMAFAMIEATTILATLVQRARFETVAGHEPEPMARVTLIPKGGMPLRVFMK